MRDIYYEEELRYLKEEGARFAKRHPQRARHLNLDSPKDRDPNVSALFEGFAFLCAGIRERVDAALPELAAGLTGLIWPQLLQPAPAACIAAFSPRPGVLQGSHIIRKGTAMLSGPDRETGVSCRFAAAHDVCVNPATISRAEVSAASGGKDALTLSIKIERGIRIEALSLSPLRVFINDDLPAALLIRKMLLHNVEAVTLKDDCGQSKALVPADTLIESGFAEDEDLFPQRQNVSRPLSMLRDYFTFPEKFMFIDIFGIDTLPPGDSPPSTLSLEIMFDRKLPGRILLTNDTFRLHCVPAVNVFRRDAEPVLVDGRKSEYRLISDGLYPECYVIHSVDTVTGIDSVTGERREYGRYSRPGSDNQRFYSLRFDGREEDSHQRDNWRGAALSVHGPQTRDGRLIKETLHIETWQTNGTLARRVLAEGASLCKALPEFPDYITFTNITIPGVPINPPPADKYLWAFLAHMSYSSSNFSCANGLKEFLRVYDWSNRGEKRPEIESIVSVSTKIIDMAVDRAVIRGTEMSIAADERVAPEENIFLLGTVLARSLSCMSPVNTFFKLVLTMTVSEKKFIWHCRAGERWAV
ncbi:MAG: type VI secretion system baseplate subunit TssF [Chitinispirillia bacterium]|nr:type VI secretion system baseplate subunit TssF [Chitinispirillia bacterium]MCL2242571.1 type VI secretion system baseplate subunit TssF [Chitinispirillia bacterium]